MTISEAANKLADQCVKFGYSNYEIHFNNKSSIVTNGSNTLKTFDRVHLSFSIGDCDHLIIDSNERIKKQSGLNLVKFSYDNSACKININGGTVESACAEAIRTFTNWHLELKHENHNYSHNSNGA